VISQLIQGGRVMRFGYHFIGHFIEFLLKYINEKYFKYYFTYVNIYKVNLYFRSHCILLHSPSKDG